MSRSVELRAERRLWRALSWTASGRAPTSAGTRPSGDPLPPRRRIAIIAVAGAVELVLLLLLLLLGVNLLLVIGVVLLLAVVALAVHIVGALWWAAGAGRPVLVLDDDTVHGRIRSASRGAARQATWWDFSVPVSRLGAVRLERASEPAQRWTIALDLPADVRDTLLREPETSRHAQRLDAAYGSPAAWQAGRMLRRGTRRDRVKALVAALDDARGPRS